MADGKGCECFAYGACECVCPDVDWTPQEVYDSRKESEALKKRVEELEKIVSDNIRITDSQYAELHSNIEEAREIIDFLVNCRSKDWKTNEKYEKAKAWLEKNK